MRMPNIAKKNDSPVHIVKLDIKTIQNHRRVDDLSTIGIRRIKNESGSKSDSVSSNDLIAISCHVISIEDEFHGKRNESYLFAAIFDSTFATHGFYTINLS